MQIRILGLVALLQLALLMAGCAKAPDCSSSEVATQVVQQLHTTGPYAYNLNREALRPRVSEAQIRILSVADQAVITDTGQATECRMVVEFIPRIDGKLASHPIVHPISVLTMYTPDHILSVYVQPHDLGDLIVRASAQ